MLPTISWPQGAKQQQRVTGFIAFTSIPYSLNLLLILNCFLCPTINQLSFYQTLLLRVLLWLELAHITTQQANII